MTELNSAFFYFTRAKKMEIIIFPFVVFEPSICPVYIQMLCCYTTTVFYIANWVFIIRKIYLHIIIYLGNTKNNEVPKSYYSYKNKYLRWPWNSTGQVMVDWGRKFDIRDDKYWNIYKISNRLVVLHNKKYNLYLAGIKWMKTSYVLKSFLLS